jgi:hypothetical protein
MSFYFYILVNLDEQYLTEHCIKIPSQSANEFLSSCQVEAQKDFAIQFGWQFAIVGTRRMQIA